MGHEVVDSDNWVLKLVVRRKKRCKQLSRRYLAAIQGVLQVSHGGIPGLAHSRLRANKKKKFWGGERGIIIKGKELANKYGGVEDRHVAQGERETSTNLLEVKAKWREDAPRSFSPLRVHRGHNAYARG